MDETSKEALERGKKEGRIDALLEEHSEHLAKINGSVGATAKALEALVAEIHKLSADSRRALRALESDLQKCIRDLVSDIRTLNEDQRIRDTALTVAAEGLAKQTEERREALVAESAASDRGSHRNELNVSRRQWSAGIAVGTTLTIVGIILTHPW